MNTENLQVITETLKDRRVCWCGAGEKFEKILDNVITLEYNIIKARR